MSQLRAFLAATFLMASSLQAHRTEGLQQSALVELLPDKVSVEVTLLFGIDVAP